MTRERITAVLEDLEFLADNGVGTTEAARRCEFASREALEKFLTRQHRIDLRSRLWKLDPTPIPKKRRATTPQPIQRLCECGCLLLGDECPACRVWARKNEAEWNRSAA